MIGNATEAMEALKALLSLQGVIERCIQTLDDPSSTEVSKAEATKILGTAEGMFERLRYVWNAKDTIEMRKRYKEVGAIKVPLEQTSKKP